MKQSEKNEIINNLIQSIGGGSFLQIVATVYSGALVSAENKTFDSDKLQFAEQAVESFMDVICKRV